MALIRVGDVVRHSGCPEWGVGHVLEIRGSLAIVCFEGSDRHREFRLPATQLQVSQESMSAPPRRCPHRTARPSSRKAAVAKNVASFEDVLAQFRSAFPQGFASDAWKKERTERDAVFARVRETLPRERWRSLAASGVEELGKLHRAVFHGTTLLHPVQAMRVSAIKDGAFWVAYASWAWDDSPEPAAFDLLVAGLSAADQATWPNATALRGVIHPATDLLVKPDSVKRVAASLHHELGYDSKPTFAGYRKLLDFAGVVRSRLESESMKPADLWDVCGFVRFGGKAQPAGVGSDGAKSREAGE
ncbi:MAG TPA: hypothetical protein VKE69_03135 [Planctomycetota bacterium]|nr:hypothetical protein [Planctomycetota bacterium]